MIFYRLKLATDLASHGEAYIMLSNSLKKEAVEM
jgi:hypothetical protein